MLDGLYARIDLADNYAVTLPHGVTHDPLVLARFLFAQRTASMDVLMRIRDAIVSRLGLKTASALQGAGDGHPRVGIFRIYRTTDTDILLGEDDRHLDFRIALHCGSVPDAPSDMQVVVSTVVSCHNATGRIYLAVIVPFHRWIVRAILRRAARRGWPGPDASIAADSR